MSLIRSKNTKPELKVRSLLHRLGYRFRIHRRDLPGKPDIVLPKYKLAIFVHGCFWHQHQGCKKATAPKKNEAFWQDKLRRNVERDRESKSHLTSMGWNVVEIWGCEIKSDIQLIMDKLQSFLNFDSNNNRE